MEIYTKFGNYQSESRKTAIYPERYKVVYPSLGLAGEAGEVCEKIKKVFRDKDGKFEKEDIMNLYKEIGDVLWYLSNLCTDLDMSLGLAASMNLAKLQSRQKRGKLQGSGDDR